MHVKNEANMARTFYNKINPKQYELRYKLFPRENYLHEHWYPEIKCLISKHCKGKTVLDLGCGTGFYIRLLSKYSSHVVGLDISKNMLGYAKAKILRNNVDFIIADAHHIPLKAESVDVSVCIGLLEYVDKFIVLKEIERILVCNGLAIICSPNKYSAHRIPIKIIAKLLNKKYPCKEPSIMELISALKGFDIITFKMDDGLIYLPNFLDKLIGKKIYLFVEKIFKPLPYIPFSNLILILGRLKV
ncbi:MAG: class I SAM-dependent methyltransferase [Candidatus Bathyarchaeia archaeon]